MPTIKQSFINAIDNQDVNELQKLIDEHDTFDLNQLMDNGATALFLALTPKIDASGNQAQPSYEIIKCLIDSKRMKGGSQFGKTTLVAYANALQGLDPRVVRQVNNFEASERSKQSLFSQTSLSASPLSTSAGGLAKLAQGENAYEDALNKPINESYARLYERYFGIRDYNTDYAVRREVDNEITKIQAYAKQHCTNEDYLHVVAQIERGVTRNAGGAPVQLTFSNGKKYTFLNSAMHASVWRALCDTNPKSYGADVDMDDKEIHARKMFYLKTLGDANVHFPPRRNLGETTRGAMCQKNTRNICVGTLAETHVDVHVNLNKYTAYQAGRRYLALSSSFLRKLDKNNRSQFWEVMHHYQLRGKSGGASDSSTAPKPSQAVQNLVKTKRQAWIDELERAEWIEPKGNEKRDTLYVLQEDYLDDEYSALIDSGFEDASVIRLFADIHDDPSSIGISDKQAQHNMKKYFSGVIQRELSSRKPRSAKEVRDELVQRCADKYPQEFGVNLSANKSIRATLKKAGGHKASAMMRDYFVWAVERAIQSEKQISDYFIHPYTEPNKPAPQMFKHAAVQANWNRQVKQSKIDYAHSVEKHSDIFNDFLTERALNKLSNQSLIKWFKGLDEEFRPRFVKAFIEKGFAEDTARKYGDIFQLSSELGLRAGHIKHLNLSNQTFVQLDLRGVDLSKQDVQKIDLVMCDLRLTGIKENKNMQQSHIMSNVVENNQATRGNGLKPKKATSTSQNSSYLHSSLSMSPTPAASDNGIGILPLFKTFEKTPILPISNRPTTPAAHTHTSQSMSSVQSPVANLVKEKANRQPSISGLHATPPQGGFANSSDNGKSPSRSGQGNVPPSNPPKKGGILRGLLIAGAVIGFVGAAVSGGLLAATLLGAISVSSLAVGIGLGQSLLVGIAALVGLFLIKPSSPSGPGGSSGQPAGYTGMQSSLGSDRGVAYKHYPTRAATLGNTHVTSLDKGLFTSAESSYDGLEQSVPQSAGRSAKYH